MAVRPQRIHDGGIVERRLRPIYDWLDNGNNKKALQEAEKVLKKSPTLQAARALKALALLRLGKASECHAVLDVLVEEKPSDDTTLQAMTISYRESHQLPKVCEIYEAAVKADPTNEELYSHLFMSYVRIGDHRSQQRTAMALYKFAPKNPYYFWAVMSIVLQAKTADDSTKRNILLSLAQRMIENFISENKMEAEQEARLYVMILELQDKWGDILKFIESPLYSQLVPGSTAQACIPYFKKIGEWRRLNLLCKDLLWDNQDRWDFYMPYFDSVFQLMKKQTGESENSVDDTPEKCHEFICSIVESMSSGRTLRGPYLARLELWKRLAKDGDPTSLLGSGVALCVQYLRVFANKTCAVPDLKPYLSMLPQKEREEHSRHFLTCLGLDENSEPENINDIQRHVSCLSAWRLTAPKGTAEENLNIANLLRRHYLRYLERGLVTATLTEFCAADNYGTLAAHHYFYAAIEQENPGAIIEALNLLELVLHHSPANFHAKLLLISLYHILGNAIAADSIYNKLEVKHIQLVSLGWLHAARLAPALAPARALRLLADTCAFHKHHAKDSVEQVTYAYKFGTFEKVVEVWEWGARVEACAWCAACGRDRALLALLAGPQPLQPLHRLPHCPTDNRDLNAIVSWCGAEGERGGRSARSFERDVAYLRLKDGLLSAIALCIECADNRSVEEKRSQFEELRVCIAAFGDALDTCRGVYGARDPFSVCAPLPSRIIAFVTSPVPYRELYTSALSLACELCAGAASRAHACAERARRALAASWEHLAAHAHPTLWQNRDALEFYSNYLEFIGVITFLLGVCHEFVAPAHAKKSKKKASQSPEQIKTTEVLSGLNDDVQQTIALLEDIFDKWPKFVYETTLEEEFSKLNISNGYQSPVEQKLKNGMEDVLTDVKNILKKKAKYLKSLQ